MSTLLSTILLGLGTVFVGLIVLIFIIKLASAIIRSFEKKNKKAAPETAAADADAAVIPDRGAVVAAVSACIATVMGADVAGLRIVSMKKID